MVLIVARGSSTRYPMSCNLLQGTTFIVPRDNVHRFEECYARVHKKFICDGKFHDSTQIAVKLLAIRLNFSVEFSVEFLFFACHLRVFCLYELASFNQAMRLKETMDEGNINLLAKVILTYGRK